MNRPGSASAWGQHGHLGNLRLLHPVEVFRAIDGRSAKLCRFG